MNQHALTQAADSLDAPVILATSKIPWRDPLLAALPHLWVGITLAASKLVGLSRPEQTATVFSQVTIISLYAFMALCVAVTIYAWLRGWPLWTASWYGYTAWLLVILVGYLTVSLGDDNWMINYALILGAIGSIALGYLLLFRRMRLHALLVALFLMPVATQLELEAIPDAWESFLALFFGLLAGLVAMYIVRSWDWVTGMALAIAANLLAGALLTYIAFYKVEIPDFYGNTPSEALAAFVTYAGIVMIFYIGPFIFWNVWELFANRRRTHHGGMSAS